MDANTALFIALVIIVGYVGVQVLFRARDITTGKVPTPKPTEVNWFLVSIGLLAALITIGAILMGKREVGYLALACLLVLYFLNRRS